MHVEQQRRIGIGVLVTQAHEHAVGVHGRCPRRDARTSCFSAVHLEPLGIGSMLDVPIWVQGTMAGVICHEHIGPRAQVLQRRLEALAALG